MKNFTAIAPAKINLQLKVFPINKGQTFHELENVMQTISLHDKLTFKIPESDEDLKKATNERNRKINDAFGIKEIQHETIELGNATVSILIDDKTGQNIKIGIEDNLITKAILKSLEVKDLGNKTHFEIILEKNIPAQAGLGGGSTDAAATILFMQKILNLSDDQVREIAGEIGCDVAFFLIGGKVKLVGRGEIVADIQESLKTPIVIAKPEGGVSTKQCYQTFDEMPHNTKEKGKFSLVNDLSIPACTINSDIEKVLACLEGVCENENVLMTGSGSACFGMCDSFDEARRACGQAKLNGFWSRACSCTSLKASLI